MELWIIRSTISRTEAPEVIEVGRGLDAWPYTLILGGPCGMRQMSQRLVQSTQGTDFKAV